MSIDYKETQSKIINLLRFPLSILVLYIHCPFARDVDMPFSFYLRESFVLGICKCAVPLFFVISGYLFFFEKQFCFNYYKKQIKKKVKSLFIPYILWNLVMIIYFAVLFKLSFGSFNVFGLNKWNDFLLLFWGTNLISDPTNIFSYDYPYNGALWFIRDLMVLFLITPFLYYILKKKVGGGIFGISVDYYDDRIFYWSDWFKS